MEARRPIEPEVLLAHAEWMRALAQRLLGDANAADDVAQDATIAAWRHPPTDDRPLEPWLSQVVRRFAWRRRRSDERRASHEARAIPPPPVPTPSETIERLDLQETLVAEVRAIDEPFRTALVQRYFEGRNSAEIARALGVPAGTVRWRLKRGIEDLRARLDERFGSRDRWALVFAPIAWRGGIAPTVAAPAPDPVSSGALAMSTAQVGWIAAAALAATAVVVWWSVGDSRSAEPVEARDFARESAVVAPPEPARDPETARDAAMAPTERRATAAESAQAEPAAAAPSPAATRIANVDARFVDEQGAPWNGVRLTAQRQWVAVTEAPSVSSASGADGRVSLSIELPDFTLFREPPRAHAFVFIAARPGCATVSLTATLRAGETAHLGDVVLGPGVRIEGRVVDAGALGIGGALVGLSPAGFAGDEGRMRRHGAEVFDRATATRSAEGGEFVLDGVAPGRVRLWAHIEGMRYAWTEPIEITAGRDVLGSEIRLTPLLATDRIAGRVVDPTGAPVPNVSLLYEARATGTTLSTSIEVDAGGEFDLLVELDESVYAFTAMDATHRFADATVGGVRPGTLDLVIRMREPRTLLVRLRDSTGERIGGGRFQIDTDLSRGPVDPKVVGSGDYELALPESEFELEASAPGFRSKKAGPFGADSLPPSLELTLARAPILRGRVVARGEPVVGARVELRRYDPRGERTVNGFRCFTSGGGASDRVMTDSEGRYAIDCDLDGAFIVRATAADWAPSDAGPFDVARIAGETGVDFTLDEGGAIEGRVLLPDGRDGEGSVVAINHGDGHPRTMRAGPGGHFRFERLAAGHWQVLARDAEIDPGSTTYSSIRSDEPIEWSCEVVAGQTTRFDLDSTR